MSSIVAIVGQPNVGKSSIFNDLTGSNAALVANFSGLTRDRQYGKALRSSAILIDTGGISESSSDLSKDVLHQTELAINESDIIFFVVDVKLGLTSLDKDISKKLRKTNKSIYLIINKVDNTKEEALSNEFIELGFKNTFLTSSAHNQGIGLLKDLLSQVSPAEDISSEDEKSLTVALLGRPNVGKSTLTNLLSGQERVLVSEKSGTTRDSIKVQIEVDGMDIDLIDTAGVRKKSSIVEETERFSVSQSVTAIKKSDVVIHLVDSDEPMVDQDMHLLGLILSIGRPVILGFNKIDLLNRKQIEELEETIKRKLEFASFINIHLMSAKLNKNIKALLPLVLEAFRSSKKDLETSLLNKILSEATDKSQPPLVGRFRPKLRYVHQGGKNPPKLIVHGNNMKGLKKSYKKYIENYFRESLKLISTPLFVDFVDSSNPYEGRTNKLSEKQKRKRKRVIKKNKKK
ncbi:MAG: ribosome biogenesis GTPase Der [Gammaproteobacteria bacterium]|nr:ribosome biogenesis GTPase Der [Gammaproteobacteria bacterium]|tara:strand:+ start:557 stop:1936 length:1380 start_codon:yes stop_codon:yes gene_type:complete